MIKYTESKDVPTNILVERLAEIVDCITNRHDRLLGELTMSIPVRLERDADCVLDEVGRRLVASEEENEQLQREVEELKEAIMIHRNLTAGKCLSEAYKADEKLWSILPPIPNSQGNSIVPTDLIFGKEQQDDEE